MHFLRNKISIGLLSSLSLVVSITTALSQSDSKVTVSGELKQWHKVTLTFDGPEVSVQDTTNNPFTDYNLTVVFAHVSGSPSYHVPGYFAADGDAANSSSTAGTKWRAHLSSDKVGQWNYSLKLLRGKNVALDDEALQSAELVGEVEGTFTIAPTDKTGRDFRSKGRLEYVGERYLRFAGTEEYFLKAGPDAPETMLAYADFDNTIAPKANAPLKSWEPHVQDWREDDPTWKDGKGKGLIGALNYLASKGANSFSFLTYNAGGDGDSVWPFVERNDKLHYDVSKLDQWGIIFDHATANGLHLHFKLQENEMDDNRFGDRRQTRDIPESLDGGALGPERQLYVRELIARFGHNLALNWNIGEENTQSTEEQNAMIRYIQEIDPYKHNVVLHTFPQHQDEVYDALLESDSPITGVSLQNSWSNVHQRTLKWINESARTGHQWVVANDEQNPASAGVPPDPGYEGHNGEARDGGRTYNLNDIRKYTLWGNLMAGGAGVEYYFGYQLPQNDLILEDFRSRDRSWDYCRIALDFFRDHEIPFWEMVNADALIGNPNNSNDKYCLAKSDEIYLVYLPDGGTTELDLTDAEGTFSVRWFNSREGGNLQAGSAATVEGGSNISLGAAPDSPDEDWVIVIQR